MFRLYMSSIMSFVIRYKLISFADKTIMSANIHPGFETDNWCRTTQGDTAKTTFTWTIEGLGNRPEKFGECIKSGGFSVVGPDDITTDWKAQFYPKGAKHENEPAIL